MAEVIVSDVVLKSAHEKIALYFGGRNKVEELQKTMMMIQARVLDAERRGEGESGALVKLWLKRLKNVLYQMEDLFEEVAIADKETELIAAGKLTKPLHNLFSKLSPFSHFRNSKVAYEVKAVMKEFKIITSEMQSLNLGVCSVDEQPSVSLSKKERTCSFIMEEEVVGRDEDKKALIDMVLDIDDVEGRYSVIPIVGIGGLGKTTLAQLVYNDKNVQKQFELRGWACVSDVVTIEEFARKILSSVTGSDCQHLSMEELQIRLQNSVNDKKYLLVLDDVWDEDRERWLSLKRLLCGGKQGSRIIVTCRSRVVALNMGTVVPYELKGLSEEKSWELFRNLVFKQGQEHRNPNLTSIGREIVKRCADVPLVIRTIAGLLYSKDAEIEWKIFNDKELRMIKQNEDSIMSTLKLSYDHLPSHLKQCFAYCSVFPKDYVLRKQHLIDLWMAQGFIMSSYGGESATDVGDVYLMDLLRRSFLLEDVRGEDGDIISCKMHDLMHDLAQYVAGEHTAVLAGSKLQINDSIRHASFIVGSSWEVPSSLLSTKQMRSVLLLSHTTLLNLNEMFSKLRCLRALDLFKADCECLPSSIGKLVHLRYLRLGCSILFLSEAITMLQNLQTLDIRACKLLREFPNGFNKLTNLRNLYNYKIGLNDMPSRFGLLTSLCTLDKFVVGESNGLDALACLNNLFGRLVIHQVKYRREAVSEAMVANLKGKKLVDLVLRWSSVYGDSTNRADEDEETLVLEYMQPPPTLKRLHVMDWTGVTFPRWGIDESPCILPNLVSLCIQFCHRCKCLPPMSQLPHLRFLELAYLEVLEYVDFDDNDIPSAAAYFPSLERLELQNLCKLKGWSRLQMKADVHQQRHDWNQQYFSTQRVFPRLSWLRIYSCPKLRSLPLVPRLESLEAYGIHGTLLKHLLCGEDPLGTLSKPCSATPFTLKKLDIESVHELDSFTINICSLESFSIKGCHELTNLVAESPSSLRQLIISDCGRLRDITGALQRLSSLEDLKLWHCEKVDLWDVKNDDDGEDEASSGRPFSLQSLKCLSSLSLYSISKLKYLPRSLSYVTSLQEIYIDELSELRGLPEWFGNLTRLRRLSIRNCHNLVALPESFRELTALQELNIWKCPELEKRCEWPDGQDRSLIPSTVSICRY
ncbi:putative disease resistance protein RGA3 [Chenopodium quinoa]|uniref:putative disease resistance protein RGA3 n=1 Tax=Chenopodium quinoa TaxID=63459 RepID=UPI000B789B73|nr:putative disease resistance protein RGA3 [Chenopodium quinoa]XP_021758052.1 putative disease resistance protein RGA3 [Chenopodium quinoa]XP_021758053.1 putative disease resistance protein RGA3 [Chenopodium quinoa]XP_021758054.1 putative disease resistance protein RGA3 [Chenopodium quinoa]